VTNSPPTPANASFWNQPNWWYKPLIWALFLAVLYLLREFFLIGFLTFLICFVVRGLVGFLKRHLFARRENRWLELTLTLLVFVGFCVGLYGVGRYFVPPVIREGKTLVAQLQNMGPAGLQNSLLANTVGTWQFQNKFGSPTDQRYQDEFNDFQRSGRNGEGLYQSFPQLDSRLQAEFEANYERAQVQHLESHPPEGKLASGQFEQWLMQIRVPNLFEEKSNYYISRWETEFLSKSKTDELATLKKQPDFESIRKQQIHQRILADLKSDPVMLSEYENQWATAQSIQKWSEFRKSSEYQTEFKSFYGSRREENAAAIPISYEFFQNLAAAYPKGKAEFLAEVQSHYKSENETLADQQHDFETATKLQLSRQWWGESHVADWVRDHAKNDGPHALEAFLGKLEEGMGQFMRVPVQIATALVLAFFMLIEWHGMKAGVVNIRETRLRPIFDEIAPGMVALGKLIGKSFQGQVVIAMFNAAFTFIALWIIGVEYKFVLALLTFLFSFIPVIGVILSGVPMVAVAIFQPGGSLMMAVQVLVAVGVIHLIESMVLAPRIIGKIGHLHPVLVIVILLVAEHFFGMWGLILGVPVAIYLIRVVILRTPIPGVYEPDAAREAI
jgi:predicted PurR-regulated permease PerM